MNAITMPSQAENDDRCKTKYPIILLHGIGYRDDMVLMASWGRIPKTLQTAGARVFLGGLDAWNTHENSAAKLKRQVEEVLKETGADKVNLIAHSKGGLEARFMISKLDMAEKAASLTTICTPHRGTSVADLVMGIVPDRLGLLRTNLFKFLAHKLGFRALDILARITGDKRPETGAAIGELTCPYMAKFNQEVADVAGVYYQSYGTTMKGPSDDPVFAVTHSLLLHEHEGENDGMVSATSCQWGNFRGLITTNDPKRGISHADMVDYRKALVSWFDIPKVYLTLVEDLKNRGF